MQSSMDIPHELLELFLPHCLETEPPADNEEFVVENPTTPHDTNGLQYYIYRPLDHISAIRLITLHRSSNFSSAPEITVHTTLLTTSEKQKYEALSYTWGSPDNPKDIIVWESRSDLPELRRTPPNPPEKAKAWKLSVTKNLHEALQYLRRSDQDRLLWIDAIAINQTDNAEKSIQVGRMSEIYTQAARVIAWIGPEESLPVTVSDDGKDIKPGTELAIQILETISQKITFDMVLSVPRAKTPEDNSWVDLAIPLPYNETELESLGCLLGKSWFERLWIWQEIRLGSETSILVCGTTTILWSSFQTAIGLLRFKKLRADVLLPEGFIDKVLYAFRLCHFNIHSVGAPLERLLFQTQHCKFTDPRDRIFALLGLLDSNSLELGLVPNYTSENADVYRDLLLKCISHRRNLDLMVYCNLEEGPKSNTKGETFDTSRDLNLPSWVPNWSSSSPYLTLKTLEGPLQSGGGKIPCETRYVASAPEQLAVRGVIVGHISTLGERHIRSSSDTIKRFIRQLAFTNVLDGIYVTGESMLDAFTKTLLLNSRAERYDPPVRTEVGLNVAREVVRSIVSDKMDVENIEKERERETENARISRMVPRVYQQIESLVFFTTQKEHIGMGPPNSQEGDVIALFLGSKCAMVLRPTTNLTCTLSEAQNYKVVGPCYIHGFMEGEAFLGPLPDSWERVIYYDKEAKRLYDIFVNAKDGEMRGEDPRLEGIGLTDGWIKAQHGYGRFFEVFKNMRTKEVSTIDPRLTVGALKERGVELMEFVLV